MKYYEYYYIHLGRKYSYGDSKCQQRLVVFVTFIKDLGHFLLYHFLATNEGVYCAVLPGSAVGCKITYSCNKPRFSTSFRL